VGDGAKRTRTGSVIAVIISHDNALPTRSARVRNSGKPDVSRTFVIPAAATAVLRWTFEAAPAHGQTATFQISADRRHWRTLKHVAVPAGTTRVRTTWKAASHAEKRCFRFDTKTVNSDLVVIRVKAAQVK
jgi:hypothetical protein